MYADSTCHMPIMEGTRVVTGLERTMRVGAAECVCAVSVSAEHERYAVCLCYTVQVRQNVSAMQFECYAPLH